MNPKISLRIAAALIFIHLMGHGVGHSTWDAPEDAKMRDVVASMKANTAEFMGAIKSMADYYNGYSLMIFGLFGMTILLLWTISGFIEKEATIARKLLLPIGLIYLLFGIIEYLYFFPFAACMSFIAGILVLIAWSTAGKRA